MMVGSVLAYPCLDLIIAGLFSLIWPMLFFWLPTLGAVITLRGRFPDPSEWKLR